MVMFLIQAFILSLACGVIAVCYREVLAYEPVLQWWFKFGNRYEKSWFFRPIWGCVKCISGQLGLWSYLFIVVIPGGVNFGLLLFGWLLTICGAILTATKLALYIQEPLKY